MKNIVKRLKPVWCLNLLLAALLALNLAAGVAFADDGSGGTDDFLTNGGTDIPPYQLTGWFFNPTADPFPSFPDPSQQWTSQANIDQINSWLNVIAQEYGNDPTVDSDAVADVETQAQVTTPEPVAASLLAAGLAFLGIYAIHRRQVVQKR